MSSWSPLNTGIVKVKSTSIQLQTREIWHPKNFPIHFLWWVILVLTNYAHLLLYISYDQSDLYMLVTTKALLVVTTRAQVNKNRGHQFHESLEKCHRANYTHHHDFMAWLLAVNQKTMDLSKVLLNRFFYLILGMSISSPMWPDPISYRSINTCYHLQHIRISAIWPLGQTMQHLVHARRDTFVFWHKLSISASLGIWWHKLDQMHC